MKRNKVFQRMTSLFLVLMMIFTMLPMQAFAASPIGSNAGAQGTDADAQGYSSSDCLI